MELLPIDTSVTEAGWTPERMARFLSLLAEAGNVRACAQACGLSAQSVYKLRRRDPLFARAWQAAVLLARDHSEQVLASRALEGVEEPIYHRGELVGTRRRYDTRLLLAHMARLDRQAEAAAAETDAGRFDELVALVAGERPDGQLRGADPRLPATCEDYAEAARTAARAAKNEELPYERTRERQDERRALIDAAGERAEGYARRDWQAWFAQACGTVDRLDGFRLRTVSTVSTAGLVAGGAM